MAMKLKNTFGFIRHHDCTLTPGVLGGYTGGTAVGMAFLGLHATEREHKPSGAVAPISTQCHVHSHAKTGDDLSACTDFDFVPQTNANQGIVHEKQPFPQRRPQVIRKFQRRGTRPPFRAVYHDKIRQNTCFDHCLADGEKLPAVTNAKLESGRLTISQFSHFGDELQQFDRSRKRVVAGR